MLEVIGAMTGKRIDLVCVGAISLRGELIKIENGVVYMKDEDGQTCYVSLDKIVVVYDAKDNEPRAGFLSGATK